MTAVTGLRYAHGPILSALEDRAAAAIDDGFTAPIGPPTQIDGQWVQAMGRLPPGEGGEITIADVTGLQDALDEKANATDVVIVSADSDNTITAGSDGGAFLGA